MASAPGTSDGVGLLTSTDDSTAQSLTIYTYYYSIANVDAREGSEALGQITQVNSPRKLIRYGREKHWHFARQVRQTEKHP